MSPNILHPDLVRAAWTAFISLRLGTRLGLGQSSAWFGSESLLGSRLDSRLETRWHDLAWSSARLGSGSSPARDSAYCSSGPRSPRLGLARLDSARIGWLTRGSVFLGSCLRLDFGLWIWARESTRWSARLSSELDSCSAHVLTQDSRLRIRLSLTRGSARLSLTRGQGQISGPFPHFSELGTFVLWNFWL